MVYDTPSMADYAYSGASEATEKVRKLEIRVLALEGLIRAAGISAPHSAVMDAANEIKAERDAAERARRQDATQKMSPSLAALYASPYGTKPTEGEG